MGRGPSPKRKKSPSFFKLFLGDFPTKLKVPLAFVKNFRGTLPNRICVKSDDLESAISWRVKLRKNGTDCYLTNGWEKIVRDLKLKLGDLLIFKLVSEEALEVVVYDPTCCEKEIEEAGRKPAARSPTGPSSSSARSLLPYKRTLTKHETNYFSLPVAVATAAEQWSKESAVIRGPDGRKWHVAMKQQTKGYRRLRFSRGWSKFIRDNSLLPEDTLCLDFKGGKNNLIKTQISRARHTARR
ncbi:B3 domain-containing protein REM10-like [Punica granatum]|uniref:B3 domain-containing protein REM10-like n=1 Tax=Punica granatum TaxID=22663 RepID=A0A6P8D594_PUNGR|nr:B3 domain-containing protein REM10-like [Punica granatum]